MITVSNGEPTRKDTIMKLLLVLTAILAFTLAEEEKREVNSNIEDSQAEATNEEILNDDADLVKAASSYVPSNLIEQQYGTQRPIQPVQTWVQPAKPQVQNDYYWTNTGGNYHHTTPQVPVIKNEIYYGDNGDYRYEYKTADGTHVGEQGWFTDPKQTDESLVKKGWYSFVGADGITYTVTYWADHTGYHAYGSHLPAPNRPYYPSQTQTPYPVHHTTQRPTYPPKPIYTTPRPTYTVKPIYPIYQTQQPTYYPTQQQTYYPQQQPGYNQPQQPTYNQQPQQQTYNPHYNV